MDTKRKTMRKRDWREERDRQTETDRQKMETGGRGRGK